MGLEQGYILPCCATAAKAGGGLDILRTGVGHHPAHFDLLGIGEQAGLDDDLQQLSAAGSLNGLDLLQHLVIQAVLHPADVDDHVNFRGAVFHRVPGLKALGSGGAVPIGETDDGANGDFARHILRRLFYIAGRDAYAGAAVLHAVIADGAGLLPGGSLAQKGVIHPPENVLYRVVHMQIALLSVRFRSVYL